MSYDLAAERAEYTARRWDTLVRLAADNPDDAWALQPTLDHLRTERHRWRHRLRVLEAEAADAAEQAKPALRLVVSP